MTEIKNCFFNLSNSAID